MQQRLDELINELDRGLRAIAGVSRMTRSLPVPADDPSPDLNAEERKHAAGLMRVNHVGEVCAQALYQAQKLSTSSPSLKALFEKAAREEEDHLAWTMQRLGSLDSRPSLLNPLWYGGALAIGLVAGRLGDRASLGFMAETERQVECHLDSHLAELPSGDAASHAIVEQMREDEAKHARTAACAGGTELPMPARWLMLAASKVMARTAYYL
ncbi:MAG: 2-polyprenyl-3-methyl-6-methoxy-1,4-benzoquinone monooxygenase [Burkholderia sp.]